MQINYANIKHRRHRVMKCFWELSIVVRTMTSTHLLLSGKRPIFHIT